MTRTKRRLIAVTLAVMGVLAVAPSASAFVVRTQGRYPGTATHPVTYLFDGDDPFDQAYWVQANARTVNENYTYRGVWQYTCIMHRLLKFTPGHYDPNSGVLYPDSWAVDQRTGWD